MPLNLPSAAHFKHTCEVPNLLQRSFQTSLQKIANHFCVPHAAPAVHLIKRTRPFGQEDSWVENFLWMVVQPSGYSSSRNTFFTARR